MVERPSVGVVDARSRYNIGELLASGGMGTIHRAYDRLAGREVAYKRLRVSNEVDRPRLNALFQREYDTLLRLSHPNIVAAHDFGFDQEGPYYAMELLPGNDVAKLAPFPWREAARLLRDVASALALVHARKLVHRDVSPNNVRISLEGHAKLLDFGALTSFGVPTEVVGTPAFMAPECLTTDALDQRVDLYALGALAYWMLTQTLAVRANSLDELADAWERPIAAPSTHAPDVPRELDELVLSLLQHDRAARPRSASDVIERLTTIAGLGPEQHEARVALGYLEHTPLCGRATTGATLRRLLTRTIAGHGGVLLIDGAHGAGRSAVLDLLGVEAQLRGATVLRAQGKVHTGPLGVMTHLVQTGLALYPQLAPHSSAPPDAGSQALAPSAESARSPLEAAERHARAMASKQELLLQIATRGPLVLLVDDAENADAQSLGLLAALGQSLARHAILLAITRLAGPHSSDSMATLASHAELVSLAPLSRAEVGELARSVFGDVPNVSRVAGWLHDESGGTPASCFQLARALLAQGEVLYTRGTFILPSELRAGLVSESVDESALASLHNVPGPSLQLARLLSLSDGALSIVQLAQAASRSTPDTFASLVPLTERKLLLESGGHYAFASHSARVALSGSIPTDEACALHLSLARALAIDDDCPLLERYAAGLHFIGAGAGYELEGAARIAAAARARNYEVALAAFSVRYLELALDVYRRHAVPDRELLDLLVPLSVAGFYGDLDAQRCHLEPAVRALSASSGVDIAHRLARVLGTRLALIVGILCALMWRRGRPPRLHRRTVQQNLESLLNVVSTATASAASIMEQGYAERCAAWLAPFAATSASSAMQIARQFCLAVSELPAGKVVSATRRLGRVMKALAGPVRGLDDRVREQMISGCLNGLAQAQMENDPVAALGAADELAKRGAFFAPHAELAHTLYHGFRGELAQTEQHRILTESIALCGGVSWSALTLLTLRSHQISLLTHDTDALIRAAAELQRAARRGLWIAQQHELAQADLLLFRRRSAEAAVAYARILDDPQAPANTFSLLAFAMYARALNESGEHERARLLAQRTLARFDRDCEPQGMHGRRLLVQQLALAEAGLCKFEQARARLDELIGLAADEQNPLTLGSLQRDRAQIALRMGDRSLFELGFAEMKRWFVLTQNPWLLQQCDAVLADAMRMGLRAAPPAPEQSGNERADDAMDGETLVGTDRLAAPTHNAHQEDRAPDNDVSAVVVRAR